MAYFVNVKKMTPDKAQMYIGYRSLVIQGVSSLISVGVIISALVALLLKTEPAGPLPQPAQQKRKKKRK
jgi:hypothetical protein